MKKNLRYLCLSFVVALSAIFCNPASAQKAPEHETLERILSFWSLTMEQLKVEQGATKDEFGIFNRFYHHEIDSMQIDFNNGVWGGTINLSNIKDYMADRKIEFSRLFKKFREAESEYPSSVDEYRIKKRFRPGGDSCFSACYNTGFEDGTFDGWYGYYAVNNSSNVAFNISAPVGGYLGSVTKAAQDPNTGNTYQLRITSGTATDAFLNTYSTYTMPQVSPYGGNYSVMLGDSSRNGQGVSILSESFLVSSSNASITYQYALFLENPGVLNRHTYTQQPFFTVAILDQNGDTIPTCGKYYQDALNGAQSPGFTGIYYPVEADTVYWRPWSIVTVPLKSYEGQCVTVVFEIQDCSLGGHFGYAYVDASCNPDNVIASSPSLCGEDSISLTAPPGNARYSWSGNPSNGIISNDTLQTVYVDTAGTYTVVVTGYAGAACTDTITITVGNAPGPPPTPSFHADTACAGQPVSFVNTSSPISGKFYWDFYNLGTYEDSLITNPTWIYSTPGTYVVKLYEVYNGCGAYYYDTITVSPSVAGSFTYTNGGCAPTNVTFTNGSTGATSYLWNFGDPTSAPNDTSTAANPNHTYTVSGTYTVSMIAKNGGPCPDTVKEVVTILGVPKILISGSDSICSGGVDTLTASGGSTYLWAPGGQTTASITVSIAGPTTYTVTGTNACGTHDTTITVNLAAPPIAVLNSNKDTICSGDTVTMTASGGSAYLWSTGATTTIIKVVPLTNTSYTVHVSLAATTCSDSAVVSIDVNPTITSTVNISEDSVCPGTPVTLFVTSSGGPPSYIWSNGATTSSITVSPDITTTYYLITEGKCADDSIGRVVTVIPFPSLNISSADTVCIGTTTTLTASGATNYLWNNGTTTNTNTVQINGDTSFIVKGTNGNCADSTRVRVNIYQPLKVLFPGDTICAGGKAIIGISVSGGKTAYTYSWNNGITWDSAGPFTVTPPPTQYICTITDGCGSVIKDTVNVIVRPSPNISFYPTPDTILGGEFVNFVNSTTGATNYYWNLGDGTTTNDTNVFHEYNQAGTYVVELIATNAFGCKDTLTKDVYVTETIVVPNVFTPNGDGINDVFHVTAGSMQTYDLQIFNRWGQKVFESQSPNIDWTGRSSSGEMEATGTYYYVLTATDYSNKTYKLDGYLQLIR